MIKKEEKKTLPILPVENIVIFPFLAVPLTATDDKSVKLIDEVVTKDKLLAAFTVIDPQKDPHNPDNIHKVGVMAVILKMLKIPDGTVKILVQGMKRIKLDKIIKEEPYLVGEVTVIEEKEEEIDVETEALMRSVKSVFARIVDRAPYLSDEAKIVVENITSPGKLADFIASQVNLKTEEKQQILAAINVKERLQKLIPLLVKEENILKIGEKIREEVKEEIDKTQREYFLREQLKAIKKELGELDEKEAEIEELRKKIKEAKMPKEAEEEALRQLARLEKVPIAAAEYTVIRTYLDWLINLPWSVETEDNLDVERARKILDEDHYDLEDVKERILEFLAVRKLRKDTKGPILCFIGPPGVGKTSLGMSIARALGRKFIRISLGGVRDEAEIRGHRRTYVGALPGRIIQGIRRAGTKNPVFMLDEIDKIGADFRGDPSAALLEVLDPEQNHSFSDHYLEVPFDLSKVLFIATGNRVDTIPPALRDRMEIIEIPGYILEDKLRIAENYLIPRQIKENGLTPEVVKFTRSAIEKIITDYTREAGVRNLEREIAACLRKVAKEIASGKEMKVVITPDKVEEFLGPPRYYSEVAARQGEVGVATGLSWTPFGGDIIFIETAKMKGKEELILTGHLGDIMRESAHAALTYVRANAQKFGIKPEAFDKCTVHVHVPEGAIPKDGPSAGVAIATALVSLFTQKPVNPKVAMTGEITLTGKVLPVGGIREKVTAAKRAGIETVILPKWNKKDLDKVPEHIKEGLKFEFVDKIEDVVRIAIGDATSS